MNIFYLNSFFVFIFGISNLHQDVLCYIFWYLVKIYFIIIIIISLF